MTLMLRPYRLGSMPATRVPYRLGDMMTAVDDVGFTPTPMPYVAPGPVDVSPKPSGIDRMIPTGVIHQGAPVPAPVVVLTPTSGAIPPPSTPIAPAPANFLTSSLFLGIPNWVLLGGAALFLLGGKK